MISKERLLAGLGELLYVEESMVTLSANFSSSMVGQIEGVGEDKKAEMKKLLAVLYRDSAAHREVVDKMIQNIKKDTRNEY